MLFIGLNDIAAASANLSRETMPELTSAFHDVTMHFQFEIWAELDTIKLLAVELRTWRMLVNEPDLTHHPFLIRPRSLAWVAYHIENERWAWEDANLDGALRSRVWRYRSYRNTLELELQINAQNYTSDGLRDLSELLSAINDEVEVLRGHFELLKIANVWESYERPYNTPRRRILRLRWRVACGSTGRKG